MKKAAYLSSSFALGSGMVAFIIGISDSDYFLAYMGLVLVVSGLLNVISHARDVIK
jgi:hypothetical protein